MFIKVDDFVFVNPDHVQAVTGAEVNQSNIHIATGEVLVNKSLSQVVDILAPSNKQKNYVNSL